MSTRKTTHSSHVEAAPSPPATSSTSATVTPPPSAAQSQAPQASPATPATPVTSSTSTALVTAVANGSNHGTKVDLQALYQAAINGLLTYYQSTDVFHMPDGTYDRDSLIAEFTKFVTAAQATKDSNAQWRADVQTERVVELKVRVLRTALKGIVTARFGVTGAPILKFGYALPKPRTKSAKTKAVAAVKALATREARGTKGKVQRKDIKGNVDVQLVVSGSNAGAASTEQPTATTTAGGGSSTLAAGAGPSTAVTSAVTGAGVPLASAGPATAPHPVTTGT